MTMWDHIREWSVVVIAALGTILAPVLFIVGIKSRVDVLENRVDNHDQEHTDVAAWLIRVEGKLDRVLTGRYKE